MKWPLLGIIVVVCLQLGFTSFNAIDRSMDSLFAVNAVTRGTNPVAKIFDDSITVNTPARHFSTGDTVVSASSWRRSVRNTDSAYVSGKRAANAANFDKFKRMSQYVAMQRPFESTVITYPRVIKAVSESDNYSIPTSANFVAAPEKRSFISKTASLLKKPYTWLKALGSRIN